MDVIVMEEVGGCWFAHKQRYEVMEDKEEEETIPANVNNFSIISMVTSVGVVVMLPLEVAVTEREEVLTLVALMNDDDGF